MQALGYPVSGFRPPRRPDGLTLTGRFVTVEPLDPDRHAMDLFTANGPAESSWDYMGYGPFATLAAYREWLTGMANRRDPVFFAARDLASHAAGALLSFLRIDEDNGVIEIGHIQISPGMRGRAAASEAIMLMIRWAFDAGYRRVEWKCNALNAASMRAAERYGFTHEGTFRQHMIVKGRNRDTAWWAITDGDWPTLDRAHRRWLAAPNFTPDGQQKNRLADLVANERGAVPQTKAITSTGCPWTPAG